MRVFNITGLSLAIVPKDGDPELKAWGYRSEDEEKMTSDVSVLYVFDVPTRHLSLVRKRIPAYFSAYPGYACHVAFFDRRYSTWPPSRRRSAQLHSESSWMTLRIGGTLLYFRQS